MGSCATQVPQRGVLSASGGGEAVRLLLGVARVLARMPEQRKLLKVRWTHLREHSCRL